MTTYYVSQGGRTTGGLSTNPADPTTLTYAMTNMTGDTDVAPHTLQFVGDITLSAGLSINRHVIFKGGKGAYDTDPMGGGLGPHPARFQRTNSLILFEGAGMTMATGKSLKLQDLCVYYSGRWPDYKGSGEMWTDIGGTSSEFGCFVVSGDTADVYFDGCEFFFGYGGADAPAGTALLANGFYTYNPTHRYSEAKTPQYWKYPASDILYDGGCSWEKSLTGGAGVFTGWNDADGDCPIYSGLGYNAIKAQYGLVRGGGRHGYMRNCYVHDMRSGWQVGPTRQSEVEISRCWFERIYQDFIFCQTIDATDAAWTGWSKVNQNVFLDVMGHGSDGANPHSDAQQRSGYPLNVTEDKAIAIGGVESNNNFFGATHKNVRATFQTHFFQAMGSGGAISGPTGDFCFIDSPRIRNNFGAFGIKGVAIGIGRDGYTRNNIFAGASWWAMGSEGANTVAFTYTRGAFDTLPDSRFLLSNSLYEGPADNNATVGKVNSSNTMNGLISNRDANNPSYYVDPSDPGDVTMTINDLYEKFRPKGVHVAKGPHQEFSTVANLLLDTLDFTGEQVWLSWLQTVDAAAATDAESQWSMLHGGNDGDLISVTFPSGVSYKTIDKDRRSNESGWTAGPVTASIAVGKCIKLKATAPAASSSQSWSIVAGGSTFTWGITSKSNNIIPRATISGSDTPHVNRVASSTALMTGESNRFFSCAFTYRRATADSGNRYFLTAGSTWLIYSASGGFRPTLRNATGSLCDLNFPNVFPVGSEVTVLFSCDLTQADPADGVRAYRSVDGGPFATITQNSTTWTPSNGDIPWGVAGLFSMFGDYAATSQRGLRGDLRLFYVDNALIDWSDPAKQALALSPDYLGPNGEGLRGDGLPPVLFAVGKAGISSSSVVGELNSSVNCNRGRSTATFPKYATGTTDAVQETDGPWPVPLAMLAEVQDAGPYEIEVGVDVKVRPIGYAGDGDTITATAVVGGDTASGWKDDTLTLPEGTGGVTFTYTPQEAGDYDLSFDGGALHGDAAIEDLTVIDPWTRVGDGEQASLTKAQRATLQWVTDDASEGEGVAVVEERWRRLTLESGPEDGVDVTFDVVEA